MYATSMLFWNFPHALTMIFVLYIYGLCLLYLNPGPGDICRICPISIGRSCWAWALLSPRLCLNNAVHILRPLLPNNEHKCKDRAHGFALMTGIRGIMKPFHFPGRY